MVELCDSVILVFEVGVGDIYTLCLWVQLKRHVHSLNSMFYAPYHMTFDFEEQFEILPYMDMAVILTMFSGLFI